MRTLTETRAKKILRKRRMICGRFEKDDDQDGEMHD